MKVTGVTGYIRVSTLRQAQDGVSIEMQQAVIAKYALFNEIVSKENEIKYYIDDGVSGKSLERPGMKKLIKDIKSGNVKVVFAYDLSRISRDMFDSDTFLHLVEKYGVVLKCIYDNPSIKTASERYSTHIKILSNQYERERVVERTNDSLKSIAESGRYPIGGKMIYGYKRGDDKNIYIDEYTSQIIKIIFNMARNHYSLIDIKNHINIEQKERVFQTYMIFNILHDERYIGILNYKGKRYNNIIPPLVSAEDFKEAGIFYRKKKFKHNSDYIFDDLVVCYICGHKMTCYHGKNRFGSKYYYYYCRKCNNNISQKALDDYFVMNSNGKKMSSTRSKELRKQLRSLNKRTKQLREEYADKTISEREYATLAIPLEDRIEDIDLQMQGFKMTKKGKNYADLVTAKEKKEYIIAHISAIIVNPETKRIIEIKYIEN